MNLDPVPHELQQMISAELNDGAYQSPTDVLMAGVRMLREHREKHAQLKADIQEAIDQAERGEYIEFDDSSLREYFERLKQRARQVALQHGTQDL